MSSPVLVGLKSKCITDATVKKLNGGPNINFVKWSRMVKWGNGGTLHPCIVWRVSGRGIPAKLAELANSDAGSVSKVSKIP